VLELLHATGQESEVDLKCPPNSLRVFLGPNQILLGAGYMFHEPQQIDYSRATNQPPAIGN
jgi:hypothetical protein